MTTAVSESNAPAPSAGPPWDLWRRQLGGILRLEVRKNIFSLRAVPLYLMALLPVVLLLLVGLVILVGDGDASTNPSQAFATIFRIYFLKVPMFVGGLFIFTQLFRGDVMDRSLHYYFLCPVRRELLVAAKYLAGWVTMSLVLVGATALTFLLTYQVFGTGVGEIFSGPALGELLAYLGTAVLGVLGYGAFFMLAGLYFKNPVLPPVALFLWELANPFLPVVAKKVSIVYYLLSLLPATGEVGPLEILAEPISPWLAVPGLLLVTALGLWLACLRIRRMEITYSED